MCRKVIDPFICLMNHLLFIISLCEIDILFGVSWRFHLSSILIYLSMIWIIFYRWQSFTIIFEWLSRFTRRYASLLGLLVKKNWLTTWLLPQVVWIVIFIEILSFASILMILCLIFHFPIKMILQRLCGFVVYGMG